MPQDIPLFAAAKLLAFSLMRSNAPTSNYILLACPSFSSLCLFYTTDVFLQIQASPQLASLQQQPPLFLQFVERPYRHVPERRV